MAVSGWSNVDNATSMLSGTWILDPLNPAATVVQFPYGGVGKQEAQDRAKTALQFAGRQYPVFEVGEARATSIQVSLQISGEEANAAAKIELARSLGRDAKIILYRDGRGRAIYGIVSDLSLTDTEMGGADVQFLVTKVDYDASLPLAT